MTKEKKDNKNKMPKSYNPNWLYLLFFAFIVFIFFQNPIADTKEISWLEFEQNMLSENDVEKIIVVNKETAEIYIKKDRLSLEKYESVSKDSILDTTNPQYFLKLGSIESFENKFEKAQENFTPQEKVEITYENRTNWTEIISWILPFAFILLFWIFILRRMSPGGMGSSMFNFGKSTAKIAKLRNRIIIDFCINTFIR